MSNTLTVHTGTLDEPKALTIARSPVALLRPIAAPADVLRAQEETRELVAKTLQQGRDYGVIPGTDKPTMLKPGAERVALSFGCYYGDPEIIEREIDHDRVVNWVKTKWVTKAKPTGWQAIKDAGLGRNRKFDGKWVWQEKSDEAGTSLGLYRYVVRVPVIARESGQVVGYGIGSCSTMESKYVDRPRDSENTALKMAHKRAMVSACLVTFGLSDQFTQDVEDMPHAADAQPEPASAPSEQQAAPSAPAEQPVPLATAEQKERIAKLLDVADINDEERGKIARTAGNPDKPLKAKRADEIIAHLAALVPKMSQADNAQFAGGR